MWVKLVPYGFISCRTCYKHVQHESSLFLFLQCWHSCLAVALHSHSHGLVHVDNLGEIFECAHLKYMASGQSKQTNKHTHACVQCSHVVWDLLRFMYPKYSYKPRFSSKLQDEIWSLGFILCRGVRKTFWLGGGGTVCICSTGHV